MFGNAKMHRPGIRERLDLDGFKRRESHISQLDVRIHKTLDKTLQLAGQFVKGWSKHFCRERWRPAGVLLEKTGRRDASVPSL